MSDDPPVDKQRLLAAETRRQLVNLPKFERQDIENGQLWKAAECYLDAANFTVRIGVKVPGNHPFWPWTGKWWEPSPDPIVNLARAEALIVLEMDRLKAKEAIGDFKWTPNMDRTRVTVARARKAKTFLPE